MSQNPCRLRRVTETGILTYHFNVWHSRKPPCVKKIETSDLHVSSKEWRKRPFSTF